MCFDHPCLGDVTDATGNRVGRHPTCLLWKMTLNTVKPVSPPGSSSPIPRNYFRGARLSWHQARRHQSVLRLLRRTSGSVLDFGCGYGDLTHAMSLTHAAYGVDVDPDRVAFAAKEYAPIPFSVCSEAGLPFPDQSFDTVASVVVVHFVPDPVAHLREARRVLKEGGCLVVACRNQCVVRNFFRRLLGCGPAPTRLWIPAQSEFRDCLHQVGFRVEEETFFYDPPFDNWTNFGQACIGAIEQVLSLFRVRLSCGYYVLLARKVSLPAL
jgi:SAM-dependent methyltransferase